MRWKALAEIYAMHSFAQPALLLQDAAPPAAAAGPAPKLAKKSGVSVRALLLTTRWNV